MTANLNLIGTETQVNLTPHQNGFQDDPDAVALTDGDFVVAYEDDDGTGPQDIFAHRFNSDGTSDSSEVTIIAEADYQYNPSVAARSGGAYAVVYEDTHHTATTDIYLTLVSGANVASPEIEVAGNTVDNSNYRFDPDIAGLADGRMIVVYTADNGTDNDIHARILNSGGTFDAGFTPVASGTGYQEDAAIASFGNTAAIVFENDAVTNDNINLVFFNGTSFGLPVAVADHPNQSVQDPDVAALSNGKFIVAYEETSDDVYGKIYNPATNSFGPEFIIHTGPGSNEDVRVVGTPDGGFLAVWEDDSGSLPEGGRNAIHAQRFDANGHPEGDEFLVNKSSPSDLDQDNPAVAANTSGQVYFAWEDSNIRSGAGEDADPDGIRGRAGLLVTDPVNGTSGNDLITATDLSETINGGDGFDVINARGGADLVNGGLGSDLITLGPGADILLFNTAIKSVANIDVVTDFNPVDDTFQLDDAIFTKLHVGALNGSAFHIGKAAHDSNDHIIYNSKTGALIYDKNGDHSGGAIQFATLAPHLDITKGDFLIV